MPSRVKNKQGLPTQGVYRIWSQNRDRAYVGSSMNLPLRYYSHRILLGLGGQFELVYDTTGSTKEQTLMKEDELLLEMKAQGVTIINPTNRELRQARGRASLLAKSTEDMEKLVLRMHEGRRALGKEERAQIVRDAWITRKKNTNA